MVQPVDRLVNIHLGFFLVGSYKSAAELWNFPAKRNRKVIQGNETPAASQRESSWLVDSSAW